jgi:hypothetical protein
MGPLNGIIGFDHLDPLNGIAAVFTLGLSPVHAEPAA